MSTPVTKLSSSASAGLDSVENRAESSVGRMPVVLIALSIVCALLAVMVLPPILGFASGYLGYRVKRVDDAVGSALIILAVVCTGIGMVIGAIMGMQALSSQG